MAGSVNKVIIVGNLGRDPEVRTTQSGSRIASLNIATSESWKDKNSGERKERTEWHRVSIFNEHLVDVADRYLRKGSKVYIEGQLETRKYEKDGIERYTTEIVLRPYRGELTLLDSRQSASGDRDDADSYGSHNDTTSSGSYASTSQGGMDDEIPF